MSSLLSIERSINFSVPVFFVLFFLIRNRRSLISMFDWLILLKIKGIELLICLLKINVIEMLIFLVVLEMKFFLQTRAVLAVTIASPLLIQLQIR